MHVFSSRAVAAALCLVAAPAAAQDRAGRATAVQPDAFQATSQVGYKVAAGAEIFRQARVYTKDYGTMEIALEDGTALTVAPNASLVIDNYVYSGAPQPGALSLSLARGALRMVSGRMPKENYAVTTSVATIGVRGTTFWLDANDPDLLQIWVTDGAVVARPVQPDQEFAFDAPAYATCSATACASGAAPPVPATYPNNPSGRQTGDAGNDDQGMDMDTDQL